MKPPIAVENGFNPQLLFPRLIHFGVAYSDLVRVSRLSSGWIDWSQRLNDLAEGYQDLALRSENPSSSAHFWRLAAIYSHYSQIKLPIGAVRSARSARVAGAFARFAELAAAPIEHREIPFGSLRLPGYLLGAGDTSPLVVLVGGLDSAKEVELFSFAQSFLERGLRCYIFDGPGQGELLGRAPLEFRFEKVLAPVIDYLSENLASAPFGVFGVSLGGFLAARGTIPDSRVAACISLGGFFDASTLLKLSPPGSALLRHSLGIPPDASVEPFARGVCVSERGCGVKPDLLVVHGTEDHLVGEDQIAKFETQIARASIWRVDGAEHVCTDRFSECLPAIGDWMAEKLSTSREARAAA